MNCADLLSRVKQNLIIGHYEDDALISGYISAAVSYAEAYQHRRSGYYGRHPMSAHTSQAVVMLASYFYESRDGGSGGLFSSTAASVENIWRAVHQLLVLDREWKV